MRVNKSVLGGFQSCFSDILCLFIMYFEWTQSVNSRRECVSCNLSVIAVINEVPVFLRRFKTPALVLMLLCN